VVTKSSKRRAQQGAWKDTKSVLQSPHDTTNKEKEAEKIIPPPAQGPRLPNTTGAKVHQPSP
jgi:hypothetical protein